MRFFFCLDMSCLLKLAGCGVSAFIWSGGFGFAFVGGYSASNFGAF